MRERFRQAGRDVLHHPHTRHGHEARVLIACELDGIEPLQGALADLLYACAPDAAWHLALLSRASVDQRLPAHVCSALLRQVHSAARLPATNALATRWSVLASPSMDVPRRAVLCSVDEARMLATEAIPALLTGNANAEEAFLMHCEEAGDSLAFMMARRVLTRHGRVLSARWDTVLNRLLAGDGR